MAGTDPAGSDAVDIETVGARLQQTLLDLYGPKMGGSALFAFVPGGSPVPDTLVQDGQVNPLQLTTWLATVGDVPLAIDVADAAITASAASMLEGRDIYGEIVRFAQPVAAPDSPAGARVLQMRNDAAAVAGGQLVLGSTPSDWPLPAAPYWTTWHSSDTTGSSTSTTTSTQTTVPVAPVRRLWELRTLVPIEARVDAPPMSPAVDPVVRRAVGPRVMVASAQRTEMAAPATRAPGAMSAMRTQAAVLPAPPVQAEAASPRLVSSLRLDAPLVRAAFAFQNSVSVPVTRTTTATSSTSTSTSTGVTVTLDHMAVSIDRTWWEDTLVRDPGWCIPGLPRGTWVGDHAPGDPVVTLPVGLLLMRNLTITGTWSDEVVTAMHTGGAALGPFDLRHGTVQSEGATTTITAMGPQLIGIFGVPLPALPPADEPVTSGSSPAPVPSPSSSDTSPAPA